MKTLMINTIDERRYKSIAQRNFDAYVNTRSV